MNKGILVLLVLVALIVGCSDDYYPPGLYGAQVERLLTSDTSKTWVLEHLVVAGEGQDLEDCTDSLRVLFDGESTANIEVYELTYQQGCAVFDTVYYGVLTTSTAGTGAENKNVFTDTLLFEGGTQEYLILESITPDRVSWRSVTPQAAVYRFRLQ